MEFLQDMIDKRYSYSTINSAKAAVSLIINIDQNSRRVLKLFMKGAFNQNPPILKYKSIWDVLVVLKYIKSMGNNVDLPLRRLSLKLTMLIALTTGQRVQTIASLRLTSLFFTQEGASIVLDDLLKTTPPLNRTFK